MKKLMERWRKLLLNEAFVPEGDDVYVAEALLKIDLTKNGKDAILSDLRSITGVTIVSKISKKRSGNIDTSHIKVKIDNSLLGLHSVDDIRKHVKRTAFKIEGVVMFAFLENLELARDVQ